MFNGKQLKCHENSPEGKFLLFIFPIIYFFFKTCTYAGDVFKSRSWHRHDPSVGPRGDARRTQIQVRWQLRVQFLITNFFLLLFGKVIGQDSLLWDSGIPFSRRLLLRVICCFHNLERHWFRSFLSLQFHLVLWEWVQVAVSFQLLYYIRLPFFLTAP